MNLFKCVSFALGFAARRRLKALAAPFMSVITATLVLGTGSAPAHAETGYDLWLRHPLVADAGKREEYKKSLAALVMERGSPTAALVRTELTRGLRGLLGVDVPTETSVGGPGRLVVGTPSSSRLVGGLG